MSVHTGHRQRLKERFLKEGLDHFEEHQVLELLLFYALPQRDTNEIAHELIRKFGSLTKVLDAAPEELAQVKYVGDNAATLFQLITAVARYYGVSRAMQEKRLETIEDCGRYLLPYFYQRNVETVYLLCMDAACKVLNCEKVGEGGINSAGVPIRKVVEMAMKAGATSVILAHNHPSGVALPSGADVQTTRRMALALDAVEILLVDHIVVADGDWVSLRQSGMYRPDECQISL